MSPCSNDEVKYQILQLKSNKSTGPNSIPTDIMHLIVDIISQPLSDIFNLSFAIGSFPDNLKIAKTIPIFKKGSKMDVSNYRPISLLSNINKILEKLMYARIYKFLIKYNCLYDLQFGFRRKHSTNHALINITEKIRGTLDNNKLACGVFVDLQKAFDTVNHSVLLEKLKYYGIRGTENDWFQSYLTDRSQYVTINGFNSDILPLSHGVPSGFGFGPFAIFNIHKRLT